ncbi:hypothetical protein EJD96_00210 (plasmid) [Herbaspirillum seropedicae]|uniref:hypothetical protein n=1 Tax=Herbaspirillum seropedicae TaxID=964 RepID=UPI001124843D|nr:hypothetical protein [Herbaspirillum seropedicae]QDD62673.1 hypothetical protein EJD96_00210 [Herbaspirillum seropedicae]
MKRSTIYAYAGAALVIGLILLMTDADRRAEEAGLLQLNQRLVNKFPTAELAQLATPVQGDER